MALSVCVAPADDGWAVSSSALEAPMFFRSGGKAEAVGRQLAQALARRGEVAELVIVVRDGTIAGRFPFPAPAQGAV